MHVSNGLPHMLTSNQRGRGHEPVTVVGNIRLAVAVNIIHPPVVVTAQDGDSPGVKKTICSNVTEEARIGQIQPFKLIVTPIKQKRKPKHEMVMQFGNFDVLCDCELYRVRRNRASHTGLV